MYEATVFTYYSMSVVAWLVFVTPVCLIYSVDARKTDNPTNETEGVGNSVTTFAELEAIRNKCRWTIQL